MAETSSVKSQGRQREGIYSSSRLERGLLVVAIAIASIGLGYLFFTQLWWKVPPDFNCPEDFTFARAGADGEIVGSSGLCHWIGLEAYYSDKPRELLKANITPAPGPEIGVSIGWAQRLNGAFIDGVVQSNIRWFGWMVCGTEAFIFLSLVLGFLSRLGALAAIGMSAHLTVGLAGIPRPPEWEWSYILMVLLSVVLFGLAPGRYFGLDRLLRPRLKVLRDRGSRVGRLLLAFT